VEAATGRGVSYISAYVFSSENWTREKDEVRHLMKLFLWVLKHEVNELNNEGIRIRVIGSRLKLGKALVKAIHQAEETTKDNERATLLLCLDYGGQQEIVESIKRIAALGIDAESITPELITEHLYAPDVPPVDLVIRTSGEQRISNFMLWESAYSELLFDKAYWPDFTEKRLQAALRTYSKRQRRFGK
jgi:undecaprenyl diphosphate synthase